MKVEIILNMLSKYKLVKLKHDNKILTRYIALLYNM